MLHPRFITHPTYATVLLPNKKTCFIKSNKVSRNLSFWKPSSVFFLLSVCIHVMRRPCWCTKQQKMAPQVLNKSQIPKIQYLHKSHNTPPLSPKTLHRHCFRLLLGHFYVPGEIANNGYANVLGGNRGVLWDCASSELFCTQTWPS